MMCIGFKGIPMHPADSTEGDPLEYENPEIIGDFPLKNVADAWGIDVAGRPYVGGYLGYFSHSQDAIRVCTDDEKVFLHELTHAAHNRLLKGKGSALKGGQHASQEIVAELGAAVLALGISALSSLVPAKEAHLAAITELGEDEINGPDKGSNEAGG